MKICFCFMVFTVAACCGRAQDEVTLPDLVQGARQWAAENLDTNVLSALPDLDREKTDKLLHDLQQQFQGEYIIDLAALRQSAEAIVPVLEASPDTQPYAAWLKPRLDYFQVADEFRLLIPPLNLESNQIPALPGNPPPQQEREVWVKKVSGRTEPAMAKGLVPQLKPIFTDEKIPPELVWLAEVESSFDSRARSPSGAAGLFQLMPGTAKRFGLSLWPRDQRYQTEPSAHASAQYLKSLYDQFGDWRLALAAYNAGEGTVQRLLDKQKTKNYDGIAQRLPAETQLFVPKIEALLHKREGVNLMELAGTPKKNPAVE